MSDSDQKPVRNPSIVLREEYDDWAILFNPDTGKGNTIDPMTVFIWKQMDGQNSIQDILTKLQGQVEDVPEDATGKIKAFVDELVENGLASWQ